jgi:hypothetical protein
VLVFSTICFFFTNSTVVATLFSSKRSYFRIINREKCHRSGLLRLFLSGDYSWRRKKGRSTILSPRWIAPPCSLEFNTAAHWVDISANGASGTFRLIVREGP